MSRKRSAPRTGAATQPELWAGATDEPAGSARPSCPVQPERDVRVKRAQRGQITWGRVDLDAEVPDPGRHLFDVAPTARFRSPSGAANCAHALSPRAPATGRARARSYGARATYGAVSPRRASSGAVTQSSAGARNSATARQASSPIIAASPNDRIPRFCDSISEP